MLTLAIRRLPHCLLGLGVEGTLRKRRLARKGWALSADSAHVLVEPYCGMRPTTGVLALSNATPEKPTLNRPLASMTVTNHI